MFKKVIYVWQAPLRFYHWLNVFLIILLLITGFYIGNPWFTSTGQNGEAHFLMARVRLWHMLAAWVFIANFIIRIYWAFAGNKYARFRPLHTGFISEFIDTLKYYAFLKKEHTLHTGHNAIAQLTYYLVVWLGSVLMILTGLALQGEINPIGFQYRVAGWVIAAFGQSYTVRMFHHLIAWAFVAFIIAHLYMVVRQDILDDDGTISSMINGHKFIVTKSQLGNEPTISGAAIREKP